jgi:hypothetical protein
METDKLITARYMALESALNERQRRLYAAVEAKVLGHGGIKRVHEATGVARGSILTGLKELEQGIEPLKGEPSRIRREGAGRKKALLNKSVFKHLNHLYGIIWIDYANRFHTMPYKHNESRRHKIKKSCYKVTNWHDYNNGLRKRGDFTIWFTEEAIADWHPAKTGARGRPQKYSDIAIVTAVFI